MNAQLNFMIARQRRAELQRACRQRQLAREGRRGLPESESKPCHAGLPRGLAFPREGSLPGIDGRLRPATNGRDKGSPKNAPAMDCSA